MTESKTDEQKINVHQAEERREVKQTLMESRKLRTLDIESESQENLMDKLEVKG